MDKLQVIKDKIVDAVELERLVNRWKLKDDTIVFTNGCFDLLHKGHFEYLAKAASLGDRVIIGLNSDASVKALKGENRPINNEEARSLGLASLHLSDAIVVFDDDTPASLIELIEPDVLVKGGDYEGKEVVGQDIAQELKLVKFIEDKSTTKTIERIKKL